MHTKTTVITFSEQKGALIQHLLQWKGLPTIVACNESDRTLYEELGCKTVQQGVNFLTTLKHLISAVNTETFTFIYPGCFVNPNYFIEAANILRAPNVGLLAPSLDVAAGPQASSGHIQFRQSVRVAPWCFSGRTTQVKSALSTKHLLLGFDVVPHICTTFALRGLFQVVCTKYILQVPITLKDRVKEADLGHYLLTQPVKTLTPVLVYTGHGDAPSYAASLFPKVIKAPLESAKLPHNSLAFVLNEGEDFDASVTKEKIKKLCTPVDPATLAYHVCVVNVWNGFKVGNLNWSLRVFQGGILRLNSLVRSNPDLIPKDATRTSGIVICRKLKDLPKASMTVQPFTSTSCTIATIMKNEKDRLAAYLSLTLPFADEVLLVDTGSQDGSDKYARKFGARVINFKFRDHFAEARNVYLKECKTKWLLHLDIDEAVDLKKVMNLILSDPPSIDGVQLQVINVMKRTRSYVHQDAVRIIKNPNSWYYTGRVHETVEECAARQSKSLVRTSGLVIYHFGYLSSNVPSKLEYYRKLNELQMQENPFDCRPYFNLALHELNHRELTDERIDKVIRMLKRSLELHNTFVLAKYELSRCYCLKALRLIEDIMQLAPHDHPLYKEVSEVHTLLKNFTRRIIVEE